MNLIEALNWRYATKRMTGEKVSETDLNTIIEAIRLAPTAYGLQPFKVTVTEDRQLLQTIYEKACPQVVVLQCSHLLIFKTKKRLDDNYVECYLSEMKRQRNATDEYIAGYRSKIRKLIENPDVNKFDWMVRQTYIALGFACVAAAESGIDTTPIEGFDSAELNNILNLNIDEEEAVVMLTLGYRNTEEDHLAHYPKIRKSIELLVDRI